MKKFVGVLLAVLLVIGAAPVQVFAAPVAEPAQPAAETEQTVSPRATGEWLSVPGIEGGQICFDSSTGTITDCSEDVVTAYIPSEINGVAVTSIGSSAFRDCSKLVSVIIDSGVTEIERYAFSRCKNLTGISISSTVKVIEERAFYSCINLIRVTMQEGLESIGNCAFYECGSLSQMTIPSSVTSIGEQAFRGCEALAGVTIPGGVKTISFEAFYRCISLKNVTISDGVEKIGPSAFYGCENLASVNIPTSMTVIGDLAFYRCYGLSGVTIPGSMESTGNHVFSESGLTRVTIMDGVKTIGDYVFKDCVDLVSVDIPNSVTKIGNYAFKGCISLPRMEIPSSVTEIGEYTFSSCASLSQVLIPSSVTKMGGCVFLDCPLLTSAGPIGSAACIQFGWTEAIPGYAFHHCGYLIDMIIPESVTKIGNSAFSDCTSLSEVDIPEDVIEIGNEAFRSCTSLLRVTLPRGITRIGQFTFQDCKSLTEITIPENVTWIGGRAFCRCVRLQKVFFRGDAPKTGIESAGGPFYECSESLTLYYNAARKSWTTPTWEGHPCYPLGESIQVPKGKYQIHVVDFNGLPLQGARVTYDKQSGTTDKYGLVTFDRFTIGTPRVTVTLDGYDGWTNEKSNWEKSDTRYETIVLYPKGLSEYKLAVCLYSNNPLDILSHCTDLLSCTKKIALKNTDPSIGDLDFGNFYIYCQSYSPEKIEKYQLWQGDDKIAESSDGYFSLSVDQFSKGGKCYIRVVSKDDKKVNTSINLEFAESKVKAENSLKLGDGLSISVEDNEIPFLGGSEISVDFPELPIDIEVTSSKLHFGFNLKVPDSDGNENEHEIWWEEVKSSFAKVDQVDSIDAIKDLIKENKNMALPAVGKIDISVAGYAEADWGSSTAKGELCIIFKASAKVFDFTTVVVVVPVTVNIEAEASLELGAEIAYNWETNTLTGGLDLNVSVGLNAFGGVGVGKLVGVGVYGDAKVGMDSRLWGTNPGVEKVDLTGELGLKAYLAFLTYEKAFAHHTWNLYTANTVNAVNMNAAAGESDSGGSMFDAASYKPHDLSYLAEESAWNGGTALRRMALRSAQAKTELKSLLTDTYRNAQPTMISTANGLYAAFLRADQATGNVYTVVTKYNGTTWAEPVRVDNTAVLDGTPGLCEDADGNIWLTYTKTTPGYDKNSLSDCAKKQSIVVGKIDPDTLTFTIVEEYAGAGYAHLQKLAMVNGVPTLAWVDSAVTDDNSVLWPQNNTLKVAQCTASTWGAAQTLTTEPKCVSQIALGEKSGALAVAYTVDKDNDYNTTEDQDLYCWANSTASLLAENVQGKVKFAKLPGQAQADFLWNQDGTLKTAGGVIVEAAGITNEYAIADDRIYYSTAGEGGGTQLTTVCYENGVWSVPVTVTGGERYLENLSAVTLGGTDYVLGMNTLATITADSFEDAKNLVWAAIQPVSDLKLEEITYESEGLTAEAKTPVTLWVTNAGDHEVTSIDIVQGGITQTKACQLQPGETRQLAVSLICPSTVTEYSFTVNETGKEDYTPADNTAKVSLGHADVAVELSEQRIGTDWSLVAVVTNNGVAPASGGISFTNADGESVGESYFENVEPGAAVIATKKISAPGDYTASLTCEGDDLYSYNNSDTINVQRSTEIQLVEQQEDGIHATIYTDQPATAFCAIYSDSGKMLGIQQAALTAGVDEKVFTFNNATAKRAKVFLLDGNQKPLALAKEIEG